MNWDLRRGRKLTTWTRHGRIWAALPLTRQYAADTGLGGWRNVRVELTWRASREARRAGFRRAKRVSPWLIGHDWMTNNLVMVAVWDPLP